jgi:predicted Fe-Mo cluster-binding NifX family protein
MAQTIVFPTNEDMGLMSKRGAHFGKARYYTVIAMDDNGEIMGVTSVKNPGHEAGGCGGAVDNICALGADALVVSGIGPAPLRGFLERNIKVFYDNVSVSVQSSLAALNAGRLNEMRPEMSCSHHSH